MWSKKELIDKQARFWVLMAGGPTCHLSTNPEAPPEGDGVKGTLGRRPQDQGRHGAPAGGAGPPRSRQRPRADS